MGGIGDTDRDMNAIGGSQMVLEAREGRMRSHGGTGYTRRQRDGDWEEMVFGEGEETCHPNTNNDISCILSFHLLVKV